MNAYLAMNSLHQICFAIGITTPSVAKNCRQRISGSGLYFRLGKPVDIQSRVSHPEHLNYVI